MINWKMKAEHEFTDWFEEDCFVEETLFQDEDGKDVDMIWPAHLASEVLIGVAKEVYDDIGRRAGWRLCRRVFEGAGCSREDFVAAVTALPEPHNDVDEALTRILDLAFIRRWDGFGLHLVEVDDGFRKE